MAHETRSVLVTGGAGFIGSHLVDRLLSEGFRVVAFDNFNEFYEPAVKRENIREHLSHPNYKLVEGDLRSAEDVRHAFEHGPFATVVHLAAMAGVRPSLVNPALYMDVNVTGTQHVVDRINEDNARNDDKTAKTRLVFGSSSSVYGARSGERFTEEDRVDMPLSPYAASKAACEVILYAAHHTKGLPVVSLRFFTVFGPRQRPDLAINKFCRLIAEGKPIEIYGDGTSKRDYTFVADIVSGIRSAMQFEFSGYEIINLGRSEPVLLIDLVRMIEKSIGKKAQLEFKPVQIGDMPYTYADITKARRLLGYEPSTSMEAGIEKFVEWFKASRAAGILSY